MSAQLGSARPAVPARPQPGHRRLERGPVERLERDPAPANSRRERVERRLARRIGDMDRAARAAGSRARRATRPRRAGQRLDQRPAIAFRPEGGRAAGGMIAGLALRLEQQHRGCAGELGGEARAGHARADDRDVERRLTRACSSRKASIRASASSADRIGLAQDLVARRRRYISSSALRQQARRRARIAAALTSRSRSAPSIRTGSVDRRQLLGREGRAAERKAARSQPQLGAPRLKPGSLLPPPELVLIALARAGQVALAPRAGAAAAPAASSTSARRAEAEPAHRVGDVGREPGRDRRAVDPHHRRDQHRRVERRLPLDQRAQQQMPAHRMADRDMRARRRRRASPRSARRDRRPADRSSSRLPPPVAARAALAAPVERGDVPAARRANGRRPRDISR